MRARLGRNAWAHRPGVGQRLRDRRAASLEWNGGRRRLSSAGRNGAGRHDARRGRVIHLEADILETKDNRNGFAEGNWVPHLVVRHELTKLDNGVTITGELMPMAASDGPHYGDNVKLMGPGK